MSTILLLCMSNVFMTFAWYGHLKYGHDWPLWKAILISWCIALLEYCLAVPANRIGFVQFSGFQLKPVIPAREPPVTKRGITPSPVPGGMELSMPESSKSNQTQT